MTILDEAKPAEEMTLANYRIRCLLSSPGSGAGKTTSACSLPGSKLLIDIDNRAEAIAGFKDVEVLGCYEINSRSPRAWMRLEDIKKELWSQARLAAKEEKEFPYSGLIVDGLTALMRICMNWSLLLDSKRGLGGCAAKQHYGPQMKNATDWILSILVLPCHVVFTGHENLVEQDGGQLACWLPKITGKLNTEVAKWFNETYYCWRESQVKDGKLGYQFFWTTQGTKKREYLKSSMNQLQKYWSDPVEVNFSKERVGFVDLLHRRFGVTGIEKGGTNSNAK